MSIKIDMTSSDVDKQMEVLKHFPELAEKHYRPVIKRDVSLLKGNIEPNIPQFTGRSAATFASKVTGRGFGLKGRVGWLKQGDPYYINIVEHGAEEHVIEAGKVSMKQFKAGQGGTSFLAIPGTYDGGDFSFRKKVRHPGMEARGFMAAGFSAIGPTVENDLSEANEKIIADLAAI